MCLCWDANNEINIGRDIGKGLTSRNDAWEEWDKSLHCTAADSQLFWHLINCKIIISLLQIWIGERTIIYSIYSKLKQFYIEQKEFQEVLNMKYNVLSPNTFKIHAIIMPLCVRFFIGLLNCLQIGLFYGFLQSAFSPRSTISQLVLMTELFCVFSCDCK